MKTEQDKKTERSDRKFSRFIYTNTDRVIKYVP